MKPATRIYDTILSEHLKTHRQMAFVSGPRQVGKTTTCRNRSSYYINWDNTDDRKLVLAGPAKIAEALKLTHLTEKIKTLLFDELHKFPRWRQFLKGFYDTYTKQMSIMVTGSSRMDIYRRSGDSLMGRYFLYHMHPFSVAESINQTLPDRKRIVRPPEKIKESDFKALWTHGGYPEPYLKRDPRFTQRWRSLRMELLIRKDIRDLSQIQQLDQLEILASFLTERSASQISYSNLAKHICVSVDTIRRWINALKSLHLGFLVRPWFKNVSRSLRKEPKWFPRDWSDIEDRGAKAETFVGCQLLKAVEGWTDMGFGKFGLYYLRDKNKREVDFLVTRDKKPWFLAEVKHKEQPLSNALKHYQTQTGAPFTFQVTIESDYVNADCFSKPRPPIIVPAKTFLSQLL